MKFAKTYLPGLTPLRGLAAILVAVYHFNDLLCRFVQDKQSFFLHKGYMMVDLFFILSGFVITHVYKDRFINEVSAWSFRQFIKARFARIYPLHIFSLILCIGLFFLIRTDTPSPVNDFGAIPTHLLLLHSFGVHSIYTWNIPSWSVSAEWGAYLLFPFVLFLLYSHRRFATILATIFILAAYLAIMFLLPRHNPLNPAAIVPHDLNSTYDYGFLRGLAGFIAGMLLYILSEKAWFSRLFAKDLTAIIFIVTTAVCLHLGIADIFLHTLVCRTCCMLCM